MYTNYPLPLRARRFFAASIDRVLAMIDSGEIVPYWIREALPDMKATIEKNGINN
ncbi:hypothetical protein O9H85_27880 [Paenibacillus filicis]|uniref:Uncharacterized protein n=1 Tax=Paenibacillus gyeongsangnamensis TaxID=3388067 RepID=A0ABT4QGY4_9BACL|nr:hypothetical protein [Paenibacillus filicis]MCZ8516150.1 hypothetical protein [Paenibacillus filicis]